MFRGARQHARNHSSKPTEVRIREVIGHPRSTMGGYVIEVNGLAPAQLAVLLCSCRCLMCVQGSETLVKVGKIAPWLQPPAPWIKVQGVRYQSVSVRLTASIFFSFLPLHFMFQGLALSIGLFTSEHFYLAKT